MQCHELPDGFELHIALGCGLQVLRLQLLQRLVGVVCSDAGVCGGRLFLACDQGAQVNQGFELEDIGLQGLRVLWLRGLGFGLVGIGLQGLRVKG